MSQEAYIAALEQKLGEMSGIEVNQIRKNQIANAVSEGKAIEEMAKCIKGITVQAPAVAKLGIINPQIDRVFGLINAELGETAGSHSLPKLQYGYEDLQPHISGEIMLVHHTKHHQAYINNVIAAAKKYEEAKAANDVNAASALWPAIQFNGGGHLNHTIFWTNMKPNGGGKPSGPLASAIDRDFGSFDKFKEEFSTASVGVKGSGWGWLGFCPKSKKLKVATCQNQDPLETTHGLKPLLGLDVWEHAYYLQYKNLRAEYVKAFFNVINWDNVAERFAKAGGQ